MANCNFKDWVKENQELVNKIHNRAADIHAEVNQKYDEYPYIYHLQSVVRELIEMDPLSEYGESFGDTFYCPLIFAAYFHDTIEDARLTYNDVKKIAKEFMDNTCAYTAAEIVYALTNEKGRNRAERANDKYYEGIRKTVFAPQVKLADRLANYRYSRDTGSRMFDVYTKEMDHFLKSIGIDDKLVEYVKNWE